MDHLGKLVVHHHVTMYSCFWYYRSGIQYPKFKHKIISQLFTSLALFVEASVFYFHLGGCSSLDTLLHQLFVAIVIGSSHYFFNSPINLFEKQNQMFQQLFSYLHQWYNS